MSVAMAAPVVGALAEPAGGGVRGRRPRWGDVRMSESAPPELRIGLLVLRPAMEADVAEYTAAQLASHAHLAQYEGWAQATPTETATQSWFAWCRSGWEQRQPVRVVQLRRRQR